MTSSSPFRFVAPLVALLLLALAAPVASADHKRNGHLGDRTLKQGHRGQDVRVLQDYLTRAGFRARVDGVFGSRTRSAVKRFERAADRRANGAVSRRDARLLRQAVENGGAVDSTKGTGGATMPTEAETRRVAPGAKATIGKDGLAVAPADAPQVVKDIIAAGNKIAKKPYRYGGGHGKWEDSGYDCSGSVSYALYGAGLLKRSMPSGGFMNWAERGKGRWVTIYANEGHMYMVVAGLRFDTSGRSDAGTRWQKDPRPTQSYSVRHPKGL